MATYGISLTPVKLQDKDLRINKILKAQLEKSYGVTGKATQIVSFIDEHNKVRKVFFDNENINIIVYRKLHPNYTVEVENLSLYEPKLLRKQRKEKENYELEMRIIREERRRKRELYLKETVRVIIDEDEKVYYESITQAARAMNTTVLKLYNAIALNMSINGHLLSYKTIKKSVLNKSDYSKYI